MSGISGDFDQLQRLKAQLAGIADGGFMRDLRLNCAEEARSLVDEQFQTQEDPFGKRWKPSLRATIEGGRTLSDTNRFHGSFGYQQTAGGFQISSNFIGAPVHQYGAVIRPVRAKALRFKLGFARGPNGRAGSWVTRQSVKIPQRMIIPEAHGSRWDDRVKAVADELLREHMGYP